MHNSQLYQNRQVQQQPAVELYDLNLVANQFANWNFNLGQALDPHTLQIAAMVVNEIQQQAVKGHPIRVGFFNIISENAFDNATFQDMVCIIMMRIGYGIQNGEWRNLDMAVNQVISRGVKACACYMANEDADFVAGLPESDARAVKENAEVWNYMVALAQGNAQYIPFSQMNTGNGLSVVSGSTQNALEAARQLRGNSAGGFVDNYDGISDTRYNNNGGQQTGRYGRRAEKMYGKLEGAMQEALAESGAGNNSTSYQSRMRRGNVQETVQVAPKRSFSQAAAQKFDSDVTDFSKSLENTAEPVQAPAKTLFSVVIDGQSIDIVRERLEGFSCWKSTRLQHFHPAWCLRTQKVRYFETSDGIVIATLQPLNNEEKEIAMNYDAHAIDPTKGKPDPKVPVKPVREEAKVLYGDAKDVKVNIVVSKTYEAVEDDNAALRAARINAEMSENVPEAYIRTSVVNSPIIYESAEVAKEDEIVIRAISNSNDFTEAASYLPKVKNDLARQIIDRILVKAINRATECELGVGIRISNFAEDGPEIIRALAKNKGALIGEKLSANQTNILSSNVHVIPAASLENYANATLAPAGEEKLSETMMGRILFLQHNVCAVWVNYTDNELAIGMPPKGAAPIQPNSMGALYKIAEAAFDDKTNGVSSPEQFLITKDSVCYGLHRGMLNSSCYLLSKKVN